MNLTISLQMRQEHINMEQECIAKNIKKERTHRKLKIK